MQAEKIEHETPPKEYKETGATGKADYADSKRYKYPIHTAKNARAALGYFSKPKNRSGYSSEEVKKVAGKIIRACKKFGIEVNEESYKTFGLRKSVSLKEALELRKS